MNKQQKSMVIPKFLVLLLFTVGITANSSETFAQANAKGIAFEQNEKLGRGINVNCDRRMQPEDFKIIKDAGFDSVRLVVAWARYSEQTPPYTIQQSFFDMADMAVEQSLANGMPIILDFHYFPMFAFGGRGSDLTYESARAWYIALWKQVADHYKNAPMDVMFELMNEPSTYLGPVRHNELMNEVIQIIRATSPRRTIVVGPECYQNIFALDNLQLPENDRNIIVAIHNYSPAEFTHQGAGYAGLGDVKDIHWGQGMYEHLDLIPDFYKASAWGIAHNRPLVMNEFGVIRNADIESGVKYLSFMTREAEKLGITWMIWAYVDGHFGLYDRTTESWKQPYLDAIIPTGE